MPAEILTSDLEQKIPEPNFFRKLLNSWNQLDRFVKTTVIVMLLIIIATPVIIIQRFSLLQRASLGTEVGVYLSNQSFSIPNNFFGQSADDADGSKWDGALGDRTSDLAPLLIRYPAAFAECWDWRNGTKFPSSVFPCDYHANLHTDTLEQFSTIIKRTGAVPVFVLNLYSSGANINDKITDQIAFLKEAETKYGMPVEYIELGNEVADRLPTHIIQFPTVDDYAREANEWIRRLSQEFPGAKISVSGLSTGDNSQLLSWNSVLLSQTPNADAITMHMYTSPYYGNASSQDQAISFTKTDDGRRSIFAMPYFMEGRLLRILNIIPPSKPIWITEHGIDDDKYWAVYGTWAEGLVRAIIGLHFVEHSDRVSFAIPQQLYSSADYGLIFRSEGSGFWGKPNGQPDSSSDAYTSTGLAYSEIAQAVGKDSQRATKIQFSPTISDVALGMTYPNLIGYYFTRSNGNQAIIINTANQDLSLTLNGQLNSFASAEILSGDYLTLVTGDTNGNPHNILKATANIADDGKVFVPAYSITRLFGVRSTPTSSQQNQQQDQQGQQNQCKPVCDPLPLRCYYNGPGPNCTCGAVICLNPTPTLVPTSTETPTQTPTPFLNNQCNPREVCSDKQGQEQNSCINYILIHGCPTPTTNPSITIEPSPSVSPTESFQSQEPQQQGNFTTSSRTCPTNSCLAPYGCYYEGAPGDPCACGNLVCVPTLTPIPAETTAATPTSTPSQSRQAAQEQQQQPSPTIDYSQFTLEPPLFPRTWELSVTSIINSIGGKNPLLQPILKSIPTPTQSQGLIRIQTTTTPQVQQPTQAAGENGGISLPQINIQIPGEPTRSVTQEPQVGIGQQIQSQARTRFFSVFDFLIGINNSIATFVKNLILGR